VERTETTLAGSTIRLPAEVGHLLDQPAACAHQPAWRRLRCWPGCAELESIPLSAIARIRVISPGWAGSRTGIRRQPDVAAVYRELLKTCAREHRHLRMFCGGMLTGMALAWFQKEGLPAPRRRRACGPFPGGQRIRR
jgi:hypothetical protein